MVDTSEITRLSLLSFQGDIYLLRSIAINKYLSFLYCPLGHIFLS